jgi:1-deoxy-D-xylulose-5-phosphate reductoisomerase
MTRPKNIVLLGATGSIGQSTQKIVADAPDQFRLVGLASRANVTGMETACRQFQPKAVTMTHPDKARELAHRLGQPVLSGERGLVELATLPEADIVLIAIVGTAGLEPALAALRAGKQLAVASKEILVMAGELVMAEARRHGTRVLPVDSEHSAIFQCMQAAGAAGARSVERLILTASGGPFRTRARAELQRVTAREALAHPTWRMGSKISIDSATLMNKGLEVIEAHWLFDIPAERIAVVIHPQSVVHSLVEFCDGSMVAQLSSPDMRTPIAYALSYPARQPLAVPRLDLVQTRELTFSAPDHTAFPCLGLAYEALRRGGTAPAVLNAANEVAVQRFLADEIAFLDIARIVAHTLQAHTAVAAPTLDDILAADAWARDRAAAFAVAAPTTQH